MSNKIERAMNRLSTRAAKAALVGYAVRAHKAQGGLLNTGEVISYPQDVEGLLALCVAYGCHTRSCEPLEALQRIQVALQKDAEWAMEGLNVCSRCQGTGVWQGKGDCFGDKSCCRCFGSKWEGVKRFKYRLTLLEKGETRR